MEDILARWGLHHVAADFEADLQRLLAGDGSGHGLLITHGDPEAAAASVTYPIEPDDLVAEMKARIASHPCYPRLLEAHIDCQKVGAPPEIVSLLDGVLQRDGGVGARSTIGADPELDDFMESYCELLERYRSELSRPLDEAAGFLNSIQTQLSELCSHGSSGSCPLVISDDAGDTYEEEFSGEIEVQEAPLNGEARDLKNMLLQKYSRYLSSLKQEFSKKKKRGKLPKEARRILLDWWNAHCKWPYPTEADKKALAESTGLDQKQINNWFINQRKRHWKPTENMQFSFMDSLSASLYADD